MQMVLARTSRQEKKTEREDSGETGMELKFWGNKNEHRQAETTDTVPDSGAPHQAGTQTTSHAPDSTHQGTSSSEVIAYKALGISPYGFLVSSSRSDFYWLPDSNQMEKCTRTNKAEPCSWDNDNNEHHCGIFACKSVKDAKEYSDYIIAKLRLGGTIFEHEKGYRAQYAVIEEVTLRYGSIDKSLYPGVQFTKELT